MSRLCFLRSVVVLTAFITPTGVGSAQRQNSSEPLASPSLVSSRRAAPPKTGQAVPVPGVPFDPRQRLHALRASTRQTNPLADPLTATSPALGTSLSASRIFLEAPVFSSGGYSANSVAVADVNGDGKPDLLVANYCPSSPCESGGTVGVLLGNGDGTFQSVITYPSGGQVAISIAAADVNADGKPDLVVANGSGVISVLLGNGDGSFQVALNYGSGGQTADSVAVADVNGDGKPDLLVANYYAGNGDYSNGTVGVLLGNGDGTFQPAATYAFAGTHTTSVAVADVNGDGKPDLVISNLCADSNCATGSVAVMLGSGNGTFQPALAYDSGGLDAYSVAVGDVNGDGKPDLLVANYDAGNGNYSNGTVGVLLGNGDGTFKPAVSYASGHGSLSLAVGDVNGDGKPDLLVGNQCSSSTGSCVGSVSVLFGNGDGTFQVEVSYSSGGSSVNSIALGDVNGDGKADLLISNQCARDTDCAGTVSVLLGKADGSFPAAINYGSGGQTANSAAVADVNGDAKPDLLVANQCESSSNCANGTVGVILGNGNGTFRPAVSYGSGGYQASWVAVADVNGDGRPDLVVANQCASSSDCANGTIGVLLQNADGSFQTAVSYGSGGYYAYSVGVSDVNRDGKPDLVVANQCASNVNCANGIVGVLLGNGDGTFQPAVTYSSGGEFAFSVAIGDVNGDGKPDVLIANEYASTANQSNGTVAVLLGNVDGTFQPAFTYGSGGKYAYTAALADMNGDGKPDVLVTNQCSIPSCVTGALGLLLGNGDGTFQSAVVTPIPQLTGVQQLAIADFDSNGTLDVASGAGDFLLLGNGDGTFQSPLILGGGGPGIAVGDFNLDGKPDLAVGGVTILLNVSSTIARTQTTTTLSSSPNPSTVDQAVNFVATVVAQNGGSPSGTVTFKDGANTLGTASIVTCNCASPGTATLPLSTLGAGTHTITAVYGGDVTFTGSTSSAITQTVLPKTATTTTLNSSLNPSYVRQSVTFTATVSPSGASGVMTFYDGGTILGTGPMNSSGQAILTTSALTSGSHSITAFYGGDSNFATSASAALTQTVNKVSTSTGLTLSPNPSTFGQSVTITAAVTSTAGVPTGTVTFYDGATTLGAGSLNSSGQTTLSTFSLAPGSHAITASYAGNSTFAGSTSTALAQTVNKANTTTSIGAQAPNPSFAGQAVAVNFAVATVSLGSGTPTGNVTVSDGAGDTCTGTVAAGGCSLILPTAGTKTLNANYAGDGNFNASTSAGITHRTVDFSISATPASQTIKAGQKTSYKVTLTPLNGFSGAISLSCTALPLGSTCSFVPTSITLTSSASSTVTVQTSKSTPKGTYNLTFTGQFGSGVPATGGLTHNAKVTLAVQ